MSSVAEFGKWLRLRGRAESTVEYYQWIVGWWIEDEEGMRAAFVSRDHSANYRRVLIAGVRSWSKFTKDKDLEEELELISLPPPAPQSPREPFSQETWGRILEEIESASYLSTAERAVCGIIAARGIRCGDVLRIQREKLDEALKTKVLVVQTKREKWSRFATLSFEKYLAMLSRLDWEGPVHLLICRGSHKSACRSIRACFDWIAKNLGMEPKDVYAHRFRHTYALYFLKELDGDSEAVFKLKDQMDWSGIKMAENYLRRDRKEELLEIEKRMEQKKRRKK